MKYKDMVIPAIIGHIDEFKQELLKNENYEVNKSINEIYFLYKNKLIAQLSYIEKEDIFFSLINSNNKKDDFQIDFSKVETIDDFAKIISSTENLIINFKRHLESFELLELAKENISEFTKKFGLALINTTTIYYNVGDIIKYSDNIKFNSNVLFRNKNDEIENINITQSFTKDKNLSFISASSFILDNISLNNKLDVIGNALNMNSFNELFKKYENKINFDYIKDLKLFVNNVVNEIELNEAQKGELIGGMIR